MNSWRRSVRDLAVLTAVLIVGCSPKDGVKELELGRAAFELRDWAKAGKSFEKCLEYAPENVDALVFLTRVRLETGEIPAAARMIARAKELASGDADIIMLAAQVAWHAKEFEASARDFSALAERADLDATVRAQALAGLGVVEMANSNCHLARIAFLRAIRLDRRCAAAWYHLGLLYRDGFGYYEAALEQLEVFVRLEKMADVRVQRVQRSLLPALKEMIARDLENRPGVSRRDSAAAATAISKAENAWKKGAYKNARKLYEEALAADPISYPAALGLAKAWVKTDATVSGQTKAFECYQRACSLRAGAVSTILTAGDFALRLGLNAQAVDLYSRAVAASPTSAAAIDGLIRALNKVGNRRQIAAAYQRYREDVVSRAAASKPAPARSKPDGKKAQVPQRAKAK